MHGRFLTPLLMFKTRLESLAATWLAGLLVLLPIALTLLLVGWFLQVLNRFVGPGSPVGQFFVWLGAPLADDSLLAYLVGTLLLFVAVYPLGLAVQAGLKQPLQRLADHTLRRIPLLGPLYDMTDKVVALLDRRQAADMRAMSPVWCFFGGDGAAVLALAPSAESIRIESRAYRAILVPTAPVPIGGGLLYVPEEWVKPADIGIDRVMSTYVSMGLTHPLPADHPARPAGAPSSEPASGQSAGTAPRR
jgi:uncharacterized membrane protein